MYLYSTGNTEKIINPKFRNKSFSLSDLCWINRSFISKRHLKNTKPDQCLSCYHIIKWSSHNSWVVAEIRGWRLWNQDWLVWDLRWSKWGGVVKKAAARGSVRGRVGTLWRRSSSHTGVRGHRAGTRSPALHTSHSTVSVSCTPPWKTDVNSD